MWPLDRYIILFYLLICIAHDQMFEDSKRKKKKWYAKIEPFDQTYEANGTE